MTRAECFQSLAEKINDAYYASPSIKVSVPVTAQEAHECFLPDYLGTIDEFDDYLVENYSLKPLTADFDDVFMILTIELEEVEPECDSSDCDCDGFCPF